MAIVDRNNARRCFNLTSVSKNIAMMERRLKCIRPSAAVVEELALQNHRTPKFSARVEMLSRVNLHKGWSSDDIIYLPQGHLAYKLRRAARET